MSETKTIGYKQYSALITIKKLSIPLSDTVNCFKLGTRVYVFDGDNGNVYSIKVKDDSILSICDDGLLIDDVLAVDIVNSLILLKSVELGYSSMRHMYGKHNTLSYSFINLTAHLGCCLYLHHIFAMYKYGIKNITIMYDNNLVVDHVDQTPIKNNSFNNLEIVSRHENIRRCWASKKPEVNLVMI